MSNTNLTDLFNGNGSTRGNGPNSSPNNSPNNNQRTANRRGTQGDDYVPSQFWLNVGIMVDAPNADGEIVPTFIQLPKGLGLDTMEETAIKPSDTPEWAEAMRARNLLLKWLKTSAEALAPGQSGFAELPFKIQIRRVPDAATAAPVGESPLLSALARAMGVAA